MNNKLNYEECLGEFKKSLEGGSEFNLLIDGITKNISTNRIRWFEVGIGDGHYLKKIVMTLEEKGFIVEVTGIDNDEKSIKDARLVFPGGRIIKKDFLSEELEGKFDVFSFNQSIYYFHNKKLVIEKCLKNLAEGGLLVCVCWSEKDKIFQFHKEVFGKWTLGAFTSEDFKELISKENKIDIVYGKLFKGKINFKLWKNQKNLEKNLYVISRIPISEGIYECNLEIAKKLINEQKDEEIRINGVVIAKKSYDIPNFTREKIEVLLKERFPNYGTEVSKMKGDLEALFMGSWEKETEYLSDYIDSGRVLEICCAAGLKSIILAKKHKVIAIDINEDRLDSARKNALLFKVDQRVEFKNVNAENFNELKKLGKFDAIYVDVDWRENLDDPIKEQNINPFKTCPRTDKLYFNLRKLNPKTPIIFKVSPFVRVKDLTKINLCVIEELFIDEKFLCYNVYFDPKIKKSRWQAIHLFNSEVIQK
ncbi:hypothetical protein COU59_00810 [Candidatus Pacearchaeota archaeon CG10_big_fil_rev_8_21_14_0_10_34_12]|nr:MAG: hypothetical protein COU59_00810 [Candidatus Pacearchaeota archaeon CG10_big_fil_rev_8_21_14_0_10_34_12]